MQIIDSEIIKQELATQREDCKAALEPLLQKIADKYPVDFFLITQYILQAYMKGQINAFKEVRKK